MSLSSLNVDLSISTPSLHPTITLHLKTPSTSILPDPCNLQAKLSIRLPDEIFLDPDELSDKFAGSAVTSYSLFNSKTQGKVKVDIERPAISNITEHTILNLNIKVSEKKFENLRIEIPLHVRYLNPTEDGKTIIKFPSTEGKIKGRWYCTEISDSLPFIDPTPVNIIIPTGQHSHQPFVELITPLVIWAGWGWLIYKIIRLRNRSKSLKEKDF
ncbi:uncharacterized protein I206_106207 [Kwoniella pini CBS 10737]|uniref:Protein PBN1 n=1 Tax=Kwoniella pini CBS 10737 TaxID=1296096 RepID=A0A1B9I1C2_9TREE|nr:uncharacterized protein I206_05031 [Kwoniella pini CBS 10737]OCF49340.1 hypothetical protein I206_05031 [Kwoniella pini CBS 10737]